MNGSSVVSRMFTRSRRGSGSTSQRSAHQASVAVPTNDTDPESWCGTSASGLIRTPTPITAVSRSEEHTSELQSLMRISYAVFCLKKKHSIQSTQIARHTRDNYTIHKNST